MTQLMLIIIVNDIKYVFIAVVFLTNTVHYLTLKHVLKSAYKYIVFYKPFIKRLSAYKC